MNRGQIMSEDERKEILDWIYQNKSSFEILPSGKLIKLICEDKEEENKSRLNKEIVYPYNLTLPISIWNIKRKIIEKEGLSQYIKEPMFGDYIMLMLSKGYLHRHIDTNEGNNIHCRFNVILETPIKGGETFYNEKKINDMTPGSYFFCKSGLEYHYANVIEEGNRISISFGFLIPKEKVDTMI